MDRTHSLDRRHRRILGLGIVASVALHAAAFASLHFSVHSVARPQTASLPRMIVPVEPAGVREDVTWWGGSS